jgi:glycosyltransferase involved in cell wall biosynthesis
MTRLALVMIVRDEARLIERCLNSAAPFVDRMLVLDTGSTDGTADLARSLGAEVRAFAWIDDFSAARNAALDAADADWNLVLDADEWIEAGGETLRALAAGAPPFLGVVDLVNRIETGGVVETSRVRLARLLPRGVRYGGRVHEQPISDLPARRLGLTVGHDGYRGEALARKRGRNEALLRAELAVRPDDAYLHFQLARELDVAGDAAGAAVHFKQALAGAKADEPWRHPLVVRAMHALKTAGDFAAALDLADREFPNWQHSPDFFFVLGDLYLDWAAMNPDKALTEMLPLVEYSWLKCLELGERDLEGSVRGRGGHMAAHNLAVLYETLRQPEAAARYRALAEDLRRSS